MTRKMLTFVTVVGLLAVGGCYVSSLGLHAEYADYEQYEESYPDYCYDCHSAPHYGSYDGCEEYVFTFSAYGYSYQPRHTEEVVVAEKEVETVKYKESRQPTEKPVRRSGAK